MDISMDIHIHGKPDYSKPNYVNILSLNLSTKLPQCTFYCWLQTNMAIFYECPWDWWRYQLVPRGKANSYATIRV